MRYVTILLLGAALVVGGYLAGCESEQPGEPGSNYAVNTLTAMLDSTPDKVTAAAKSAADDLKLQNIGALGTKVDGKVTAYTADNTEVTIKIEQAGDNVSKVTIQVGTTGDQNLSGKLLERIKAHLSWF